LRLLTVIMTIVITAGLSTSCDKSSDDNKSDQGGLTPDPSIPTISDIKYELSPTAVIVPEAITRQISAVDTLKQVMTLPATGDAPEVGQVLIINTPTKDLPDGLLAKVTWVKETNNGYEVSYDCAELMDAFKSIDIPEQYIPLNDMVEHIYDMDGNELQFSRGVATRTSGIKPIELTMPEKALKFGDIEITPKMSISMMMRYVLQAADYEIDYAHCAIDGEITLGADLNMKTLSEAKLLNKRIPLVRVSFGAIPVGPVLLTPWVQLNFIIKAEGAITLEASISYTRTVHTAVHYEKGHGLSASMYFDPEAPDALKYSFGPKFEGGFSYGIGTGVIIGLYGKVFTMGGSLQTFNKYTISSKLDLVALEGGFMDYLEAVVFPGNVLKGSKWKFLNWEGLSLNQALVAGFSANLTVLNHQLANFNVTELNFPIDSSPIMPQVKIDDNDFYQLSEKGKEVTLTLHHVKKSVLDDLTEFRAEFKPLGNKDEKKTIVKYFNFDDDIRNWLKADVKGKDVTTSAKATLDEDESYDITVYMNVVGIDIPIFVSEQKGLGDMKNVDFTCSATCTLDGEKTVGYSYNGLYFDGFGCSVYPEKNEFTVTPIGKNGSFKCTGSMNRDYNDGYYKHIKQKGTFTFTVYKQNDGSFGKAQDVEWEFEEETFHTIYNFTVKIKDSGKGTDLPVTWTNKAGTSFVWKGSASDGVKLTKFHHSCVIVDEKGETKKSYSFDKADEYELRIGADFESQ